MILSLSIIDLRNYVLNQLNYFFPDNQLIKPNEIETVLNDVLDRLDYCFEKVNNKNYREHSQSIFNHLYSDQYLVFLWFLSNTIWKKSENKLFAYGVPRLQRASFIID
jgi:serine O-acetyltransferase